ncbi:hypothetical protein NLX86_07265 [Streptomyces sp. A3M-1-3]|uniref:hypothetical protein n=1 Tax=Streptomyces sp. A3M-1-3 TaxID=2962044 RepID=UPI0020B702B6|nr:hypothetical protein [Streptomyces sp. A3M-1-3]MCP3817939.1 hypothetical protein [Streptomyces sp. A3M-1-3]
MTQQNAFDRYRTTGADWFVALACAAAALTLARFTVAHTVGSVVVWVLVGCSALACANAWLDMTRKRPTTLRVAGCVAASCAPVAASAVLLV